MIFLTCHTFIMQFLCLIVSYVGCLSSVVCVCLSIYAPSPQQTFCLLLSFIFRQRFIPFSKILWQMPLLENSEVLPSYKQNTKQPSALLTAMVLRHDSLLGAEIATMLLLDHSDPQSVHPSTSKSPAVCHWVLALIQRGDPASPRMQHTKLCPPTHTTNRDKGQVDKQGLW